MKKVVRLTESDLVNLVKKVLNEQQNNLVGKTVNLYKDKKQTQLYQTITIKNIELERDKTGDIIQIKVPGLERVRLTGDHPDWSTGNRIFRDQYKELCYKVNCVRTNEIPPIQLTYVRPSLEEIKRSSERGDTEGFNTYDGSFREKIGEKLYYNDKFVKTILPMFCKSSNSKPVDFASVQSQSNSKEDFA